MPTILLVEDNKIIRKLYKDVLTKNGYEVIDTDNCDVLHILELEHIDVVLIDQNIKCVNDIRMKYPASKIIMLTSDSQIINKKIQSWGIRVRIKPVNVSDLVTEINNLLAISKMDADRDSDAILEKLSQTSGRNRYSVQDSH
jgi:DNA-binding response OmpR family regulator